MELGVSFWTCHDLNLSRGSNATACALHRTLLPLDPAGRLMMKVLQFLPP